MSTLTRFKYQNNELVLEPHDEIINKLLEKESTEPICVVSFIGSTHSGKSTLIQSITDHEVVVADPNSTIPTSANITAFDLSSDLRFLDFEGSSAGNKLPFNEQLTLPSNVTETQYCRLRRQAVSKLPALAYVASDIIVFVANVDFADYDTFYEKMKKVAIDQAVQNVEEVEKPTLILVSNRIADQSNEAHYQSEQITKDFIELMGDDFQELEKYYLKILCVRIPNWNATGTQLYHNQIEKLHNIINQIRDERMLHKVATGTIYTSNLWLKLFMKSIDAQMPFRMSDILGQCMVEESKNESMITAMNFFKACRVDFSRKVFDIIGHYSLLMLATHLVYANLRKAKKMGEGYYCTKYVEERKKNYQESKTLFIEVINKLQYNDPNDSKIGHRFVRFLKIDKLLTKNKGSNLNTQDFDKLVEFLEASGSKQVCYQMFLEIFLEFKKELGWNQNDFASALRYNKSCLITGFEGGYNIPCGHNCFNEQWMKYIRTFQDPIHSIHFCPGEIILLRSSMCPICNRIFFTG